MKHWFLAWMLVFLVGCNIQTVEDYEKQQAPNERSVTEQPSKSEQTQQPKSPTVKEDKPAVDKDKPTVDENKLTDKNREQSVKEPATASTKPAEKQTAPTKPATSENSKQQTSKSTPKRPESTQQKAPPVDKKMVTISIDAKTLLNESHYAKLDPALRSKKYVPSNGVILKPTKYEITKKNETVFDILLRATREFNIHIEYQGADENIYNSVYIEGINHLYEFSAGNLSGWMYAVNGTAPAKGASQYVVQPNDVITWHYTVDLGKDLAGVAID